MTGWELLAVLALLVGGHSYIAFQYFFSLFDGAADKHEVPVLCYFGLDSGWPDNGTLHPALNATLCTHIMFIDTGVKDGQIAVEDETVITKYFNKIPTLKKLNPKLKVLVTNGGGGEKGFTPLLATRANRTLFVKSTIPFLQKYGFDGLDLDFEFPGGNDLPIGQRTNFTLLTQELRDTFDKHADSGGKKYILSSAVGAGRIVMEVYQIPGLAKSLDFVNLMTYDLYSYAPYDKLTGYNSPLYPNSWQRRIVAIAGNVGWSSYEWHRRGMPKSKIMVGIPTFIHAWTLAEPDIFNGTDAPASGPGKLDGCGYIQVCEFLRRNGTTYVWDDDAAVPYAYNGDQWLSFDNQRSVAAKAKWAVENGFGGVMIFSMNADDISGACAQGKFPLISTIQQAVGNNKLTTQL